jgi:uncharacterized protein (DUF736 family)
MEKKNNNGALFTNKKKNSHQSPDLQGTCVVNETEMQVVAWEKVSQKGEKYFSLAFSLPYNSKEPKYDYAGNVSKTDVPFQ